MRRVFEEFSLGEKLEKPPQGASNLAIALQGGGSYGAYAKGVLTTLFDSDAFRLQHYKLTSMAGTSAGAINGALSVSGINASGYDQAIEQLNKFWDDIGRVSMFKSAVYPNLSSLEVSMGAPFQQLVLSTLKSKLNSNIKDWDALRSGPVKLYTNAVELMPDQSRRHIVFDPSEASADTVIASTALEELGAHSFNGRKFHDGAYWRNPCTDDVLKGHVDDLLIITLQRKPKGPIRARHQDDFQRAVAGQALGTRLITSEIYHHIAHLKALRPDVNIHTISLDVDPKWDDTSRMNNDKGWLRELSDMGTEDAQSWLVGAAEPLPLVQP